MKRKRRQTEHASRVSASEYQTLLNNISDALFINDLSGQFVEVNSVACQRLGYSREELLQKTPEEIGLPPNAPRVNERMEEISQRGSLVFETVHVTRDGREIPTEINSRRIEFEGRPAILSVARDITERKQAEAALREEHSFRTGIIERAAEGLCVCHQVPEAPHVQFTVWNDRMTEITGYTMEQINRLGWFQTLCPDADVEARFRERMKRMRDGDDLRGEEWEITRADGQTRTLRISTSVLATEDGIAHALALMQDVTGPKREQSALRLTQFSVDHAAEAVFWIGPDAGFLYVNDMACRTLGYSRQELLCMSVHDMDPDFPAEVWPAHWRDLKRGGILTFESRHRRKDGTVFPVEVTANYVEFEGKEYNCAFARDITERKQAEEALRSQRDLLGRIAETSPVGITVVDRDGRITFANSAAERVLGVVRDDVTRRTYNDPAWRITDYAGRDFPDGELPFHKVKASGRPVQDVRHAIEWPNGQRVLLSINAAPLLDESGRFDGMVATIADVTERVRAEGALRASEANYRAIFNAVNDAIFVHDPETGEILDFNERACEMFGYTAEEMRRLDMTDMSAEDPQITRDGAMEAVRKTVAGEPQLTEWPVRKKDGTVFWVEIAVRLARVGETPCILAVLRDITERKKDKEALWASEREKETILDSLVEHVIHQDRTMRVLWANQAACKAAGLAREELIGRHCYAVWQGLSDPCEDCPVVKAMETGRPQEGETTTPDGRAWYIRGYPVSSATGEIVSGIEVTLEITERKRAEEDRDTSERRYRELYESSRDGYAMVDMEGTILESNSAFRDMLGYSDEELRKKTYHDITPERWHEAEERIIEEQVVKRGYSDVYQKEYRRKDGTIIPIEIRTYLLTGPDGQPTAMWAYVRDVSQRRLLEEELVQAQKMEAVGRLAGGIAHDFNNQLTVIRGYCDILLQQCGPGQPLREEVQEIQQAAERARRLTGQLLAFSRRQVLRPEVTDLNDVLTEIRNPLARMIGEDIQLAVITDQNLGNARVDVSQVYQAIMNMAVNARDAMPDGGKLTVETANVALDADFCRRHRDASPGEYVMLAVSDTGEGMDERTRDRVFEPFFTTKEVGKGTGLGLSMVYGFVKQSGGLIYVDSKPGGGTVLRIYLPRVRAAAEGPAHAPPAELRRGTETILVAEDDESVRQLVVRVLRRRGYTVLETAGPQEALPLGEHYEGTIDLLVTDVVMPTMRGPELAARLRVTRPALQVLYVSGYTEDSALARRLVGQGVRLLAKPFDPEGLAQMVRCILDEAKQQPPAGHA